MVVNDEEQYSIWPVDRDDAPGWRGVGVDGSQDECLAWIDEHWTDMRPLSLRRHMAAYTAGGAAVESGTTALGG